MFSLFAASFLAASDPAPHPLSARLDTLAPSLLEQYDVPSVGIAFIEDGKIAFVSHYGEQEWGVLASEETLYNVASLTKPVTAETVLRMANRGEIDLGMSLARYHLDPDIDTDPRASLITPRLVMRHRTGLPNWRYEKDDRLTFLRDPDLETGYSGEGYEWMAEAVEKAAGRDFDEAARSLVFKPLGLTLTSYTKTGKFFGRIAFPYKKGESVYNVVRNEMSAADDLRTTPREYALFMIDVMEGSAVDPAVRQEQRTITNPFVPKPACEGEVKADFCPRESGWGLGWFIHDYGDRKILQHDGGDQGEKALAFYDVIHRRGAVILTNGAEGHEVMHRIAAILDGDPRWGRYLLSPWN